MDIELREGMTLSPGERVAVYYNLNKGGFSIKSLDKRNPNKGKVVAYASNVFIEDATFHASMAGLARIKKQGWKEIYAVVRGNFVHTNEISNEGRKLGYCNPRVPGAESFIDWDTKAPLTTAANVYFYDRHISYT